LKTSLDDIFVLEVLNYPRKLGEIFISMYATYRGGDGALLIVV